MSKEKITAYLKEKAKTQDIDKREFPRLTELIQGYLNQPEIVKNCWFCKYFLSEYLYEPCLSCDNTFSNFEPKE